jgi:hypothetical protein
VVRTVADNLFAQNVGVERLQTERLKAGKDTACQECDKRACVRKIERSCATMPHNKVKEQRKRGAPTRRSTSERTSQASEARASGGRRF